MALNTQFADVLVDAMATAFATKFNSAKIHICTGSRTGSDLNGQNPITGGATLVVFTMNATAFGSPTSGVIVANAIGTATAASTGTATFARFVEDSYGGTNASVISGQAATSVLMDCTAGISAANLIISPITVGTNVSIGSFTHEVLNAFSGQ